MSDALPNKQSSIFAQHGLTHLSPSSINLYVGDPSKWVAEKILGHRGPPGAAMARGSAIETGVVAVLTGDSIEDGTAKALAEKVIDAAYGYQMGAVLFKPTLTVAPQTFRTTRAGALAYFVGGDPAFPKDTGFALKGWTKVEIKNFGIFIAGDSATTMGNVMITGKDGKVTTVDKSWKFVKDDAGKLRIVLHHSSLPYSM